MRIPADVWVCFAVREEASEFKRRLGNRDGFALWISGIGRRNAERMMREALDTATPRLVFTCGFAGALDASLRIGDVLFDEDANAGFAPALRSLGSAPAVFHSSDHVAVTAAEKAELRRTTGADAVEMESAVIRQICRERQIPGVTLRVISDTAAEDLPLDFNRLLTRDQRLSPLKFAGALLRSPGSVPRLMRLHRNTAFAARRLSDVLCGLLRVV